MFTVFCHYTDCPTGPAGIVTCLGLEDGDYQDCNHCGGFIKCVGEVMFPWPCPSVTVVWDDITKNCEWVSETCSEP